MELKVVVLGVGAVGKSAVTTRFVHDKWAEGYNPTIEDNFRKQLMVGRYSVLFDIIDTAGQEEWQAMRDQWIRSGEAFIIVYAINQAASFNEVNEFFTQIDIVKEDQVCPIIVVANKCDLEVERQVQAKQGKDLADSKGAAFIEASAKTRTHIEEIFLDLAQQKIKLIEGKKKKK